MKTSEKKVPKQTSTSSDTKQNSHSMNKLLLWDSKSTAGGSWKRDHFDDTLKKTL